MTVRTLSLRWIERTGGGAFADVWRGASLNDGKEYAVKFLREPCTPVTLRRFRREGDVMVRLTHPNLVRCFGIFEFVGQNGGRVPGLVMEYQPGKSLSDKLKIGRPSTSQTIRWAREVLRGLQAAHEAGFIHRDINPNNIVLDRQGTAKIVDFGLAKILSLGGDGLTIGPVGTPGYIAPELLDESRTADARSDIYSVGVMLYFMLTGRLLQFEGGRIVPPSRFNHAINKDLDRIVLQMIATEPGARTQSAAAADAVLHPLFTLYDKWERQQARLAMESFREGLAMVATVALCVGLVVLFSKEAA
ncbi:MAG: serine/threonine-protein kinase [Planctomycetota bacterium]